MHFSFGRDDACFLYKSIYWLGQNIALLVKLSEIGEIYEGKRITTFGWVRSAEVKSGRRGSLHLEIIVGEGEHSVFVYTIHPFPNIIHREGIYHEHGRFAGHPVTHYIVADTIVRDWPEKESRH